MLGFLINSQQCLRITSIINSLVRDAFLGTQSFRLRNLSFYFVPRSRCRPSRRNSLRLQRTKFDQVLEKWLSLIAGWEFSFGSRWSIQFHSQFVRTSPSTIRPHPHRVSAVVRSTGVRRALNVEEVETSHLLANFQSGGKSVCVYFLGAPWECKSFSLGFCEKHRYLSIYIPAFEKRVNNSRLNLPKLPQSTNPFAPTRIKPWLPSRTPVVVGRWL